jgi:methylthioribose-1-phosphate isomerase
VRAIADMVVRGAPLIGATAAYGMALALRQDASDAGLARAYAQLLATRPTAVNLRWASGRNARCNGQVATGGARGRRLPPRGPDLRR